MGKLIIEETRIIFQRKDELTVIEPYGPDCIRCRSTRNAKLLEESFTLLPPLPCKDVKVEGDSHFATLYNGLITVTIDAGTPAYGGIITYYKNHKRVLHTRYEGDYTSQYQHIEGEHYQIKLVFDANDGEHFYGLGQEQVDIFDRKGCSTELIHYNTKSTMPVLYSSLGYGFLWNSPGIGRCETTRNHTMWVSNSAYQSDYLVFAGMTPAKTLQRYCDLTGYAPNYPEWAAGFWQSKLRYESQEDLLEVAREYQRRGIPLAAIVIDFFHWTEQGDWQFDPTYWPDPTAMCKELKEMGIQPVVSIWPTINPKSENYMNMSEENMLLRSEHGQYGLFDFQGQQTFIDPTNPKTGPYLWNIIRENYYHHGIKTFWLDEAEPEIHPQDFSNLNMYLGNGVQTALLYPYYYNKIFYEGLRSEGEEDIILLTRAAYPGIQRFGALVWNGDIPSTFEALRMSIKSGLSMGMCGIPWWNSDIGGFYGADIESSQFRELIVRWFQFGVFSPVMRLHGCRNKTSNQVDRHPEVKECSGGDNELWSFGVRNYSILKSLVELRERLKPYILHYMKIASATGSPIMRPMFFDYYEDETCYLLEDQYFFGEDILFAPITYEKQTTRTVYLPEGTWIQINDKKKYEGRQYVNCHASIEEFIAFVKDGSTVIDVFK